MDRPELATKVARGDFALFSRAGWPLLRRQPRQGHAEGSMSDCSNCSKQPKNKTFASCYIVTHLVSIQRTTLEKGESKTVSVTALQVNAKGEIRWRRSTPWKKVEKRSKEHAFIVGNPLSSWGPTQMRDTKLESAACHSTLACCGNVILCSVMPSSTSRPKLPQKCDLLEKNPLK